MYSVVLLMALSTGADVPAGHGCFGGCNGCAVSCNGGGHGCRGGLFGGHGCRGCNGGGHGLFSRHRSGCNGCNNGCNNGCWSACSGYNGCNGCHGGCYAGACHGGYACHGAAACGAACYGAPAGKPKDMPKPKDGDKEVAAPATIIVTLPADAKLLVDDNPTISTSTTRVLVSPPLEPGKEYNYTLKGEISRDGQTVSKIEQITVRAGEEARVSIEFPTASVAQK